MTEETIFLFDLNEKIIALSLITLQYKITNIMYLNQIYLQQLFTQTVFPQYSDKTRFIDKTLR